MNTGTDVQATFGSAPFGYYLYDSKNGRYFYSQSFLNPDGADQMVAFAGQNQTMK